MLSDFREMVMHPVEISLLILVVEPSDRAHSPGIGIVEQDEAPGELGTGGRGASTPEAMMLGKV